MTDELWDEFERHMRKQDEEADSPGISIGHKDKGGNLLILGGHKANLWRLDSGLFSIAGERIADPEDAIMLYNQYNGTSIPLNYIRETFIPWYEKQFTIVANVPSRTSNKTYTVRKGPSGELLCECPGFRFRHECWHIEATKELING